MFYSLAAHPLIPSESSLVAGISAFPAGRFVLYRDAKDTNTSTDRIKYLTKWYTRVPAKETDLYWRFERGSQVIFTYGEPMTGSVVYVLQNGTYNRTGYYVDEVDIDINQDNFKSYQKAVEVWDTVLNRYNLVSNKKRTELLTLTAQDSTQINGYLAFYWVRMTGKLLAKTTGEYTFGVSFGNGTVALRINNTNAVSSTRSNSGTITLFSVFLRQGAYDLDFLYKHMNNTSYYGHYTIYIKRPGETELTELRLDDLTTIGLH